MPPLRHAHRPDSFPLRDATLAAIRAANELDGEMRLDLMRCRLLAAIAAERGAETPRPPNHNATCLGGRIMASSIVVARCAYCARPGLNVFTFRLLSECCIKARVRLKAPRSEWFHPHCSRLAYAALTKKAPHFGATLAN